MENKLVKFHIEPLRFVKKKVWWDLPSTNPCLEIVLPVSQQTARLHVLGVESTSSCVLPSFERLYSRHSGLNRGELDLIMGRQTISCGYTSHAEGWLRNL